MREARTRAAVVVLFTIFFFFSLSDGVFAGQASISDNSLESSDDSITVGATSTLIGEYYVEGNTWSDTLTVERISDGTDITDACVGGVPIKLVGCSLTGNIDTYCVCDAAFTVTCTDLIISNPAGTITWTVEGCEAGAGFVAYRSTPLDTAYWGAGIGVFTSPQIVEGEESTGPGGYGWQQYYRIDLLSGLGVRVTGSADREYYDWGYKGIQISGRKENYWSKDCGWWYVSSESTLYVDIKDNSSNAVVTDGGPISTTKGLATYNYSWGGANEAPGTWTVWVKNQSGASGTLNATFKTYVRGQLNVTDVITNQVGSVVYVNATVQDHTGTNVTGSTTNKPTVTMYVTGPGFYNESIMSYGTNYWESSFDAASKPGDYLVTIKAGDGHTYWVDGWGSADMIPVSGSFPYSFAGAGGPPAQIAKVILMILLALLLLRSGRKAAMAAVLIFMGGIK